MKGLQSSYNKVMHPSMGIIRILLVHWAANLRSETVRPYFAFQSTGILHEAPVLLGLDTRTCIWLAEKRNCKCSILLSSSQHCEMVKKRKRGFIALDSLPPQLFPNCLLNEIMGRIPVFFSNNVKSPGWMGLRSSDSSFVLKFHYSYLYCSLLSNSLRKECARKTQHFYGGERTTWRETQLSTPQ